MSKKAIETQKQAYLEEEESPVEGKSRIVQ